MERSSSSPTTQKPSENPQSFDEFPPYRRRPPRSKTFYQLVQTLSHCHHQDSQRSRPLPSLPQLHKPDNGSVNGIGQPATLQFDQSVCHNDLGPKDALVHEKLSVDESREVVSSQDPGSASEQMEIDGLDPVDIVKENGDLGHVHIIENVNLMVDKSLKNTNENANLMVDNSLKNTNDSAAQIDNQEVLSLESKRVDKLRTYKDLIDKVESSWKECQGAFEKDNLSDPLPLNTDNNMSNAMEVEPRKDYRNLVENRSKLVFYGDIIEDKSANGSSNSRIESRRNKKKGSQPDEAKSPVPPVSRPENLSFNGGSLGENETENQCSASAEKDVGVSGKKRKRGPGSQESKAKKKKKERIKRAEKNRKLGVNKLRLKPPVPKPKTVKTCRHYLKGRCHEGEKCKFSHDAIPLTKSKPCCHFARNSCMKGDDCPYDHELSKYPCNNYVSQGSCCRGADCLFSHELPVKEDSAITKDVSRPELKSISKESQSNFKSQLSPNGIRHQNASATSSCKSKEQNVAEVPPKPAGQAPRGISLISNNNFSAGNTSKHTQSTLSPKADNGVKISQQIISSTSTLVIQKSNDNTKTIPAVAPRGRNFLSSFGKAPSENSGSKKEYLLSSTNNMVNGQMLLSGPGKGEQAQLDVSADKRQAGFHFSADNAIPPTVHNRESRPGPNKLQILTPAPSLLPTSSLPCSQSLDNLVNVQSKSTASSSCQSPFLLNVRSSVQKALRSTLALAAKFESEVKKDLITPSTLSNEASSSRNKPMNPTMAFEALFGSSSKSKQ